MGLWRFLLGVVLVLIGAVLLRVCARVIRNGQRRRDWPTVPGLVTRCEIFESHTDSDGHASYELDVTYRYEVAGARHWGFVRPIGGASKAECRQMQDRYAPGTEVEVYYDPADPRTSTLSVGGWEIMWVPIAALAMLVGVGIWNCVAAVL